MIVFHNFFHSLSGSPGENEFSFHWFRFFEVWLQIVDEPLDFLRPIVSFFGHYGVHIFIFLSGYGLTRKCLKIFSPLSREPSFGDLYGIVFKQVLKLWKLMFLGGGVAVVVWWVSLSDPEWSRRIYEFLWTITFTNAIVPEHRYYFVSVWWFFSLIVQFYLFFPLLFRYIPVEGRTFGYFLGVSILLGALLYSPMRHAGVAVYGTILGQLPLFALGVWLAKDGFFPDMKRKTIIWLLTLLVASWVFRPFFHMSFFLFVIAFIVFYEKMRASLDWPLLNYIGGISSFVFVVHGEIRRPILAWLESVDYSGRLIEYGSFVVYFFLVILVSVFLRWFSVKINLFERKSGMG